MTEPNKPVQDVIDEHYTRLSKDYDAFLYYSDDFVRTLTRKMVTMLRLQESDILVDLGCGTGMYSIDILAQVPLSHPVTGVDPFPQMLEQIPENAPITPVALDALAFSERPGNYDKVLMKEAVHHVEDRARLFGNLAERLPRGGVLLLVHVPPRVQYPLFQAALERCERWHADPDELEHLLGEAGFRVEREGLDYRHSIDKDAYFRMVAGQYMSVLSSFEDDDIRRGLAEMADRYREETVLEFTDHFDYIAGIKA